MTHTNPSAAFRIRDPPSQLSFTTLSFAGIHFWYLSAKSLHCPFILPLSAELVASPC